jgi:hypothetical protein
MATALTIAVFACGDDESESGGSPTGSPTTASDGGSAAEATEQLCEDLNELEEAVFTLQGINETKTVDELQAARDGVQEALADVRTSAADVAEARVDDLESSFENLNETVDSVEGDQTLAEVQSDLQDAAVDVLLAHAALRDRANCPESATGSPRATSTP